jgi:hypothetical protein
MAKLGTAKTLMTLIRREGEMGRWGDGGRALKRSPKGLRDEVRGK